jgi:hypothetical protein
MEFLEPNVEFKVVEVDVNIFSERVTIMLLPLDHAFYTDPMRVSFHIKHDYNDYKYYRVFLKNNSLSFGELNGLVGKRFRGNIVRFKRRDGTQWDGVYSSSLRIQSQPDPSPAVVQKIQPRAKNNKPTQYSVNIMPKIKNQKNLKQMATEVLQASGVPMSSKEIWNEISKTGYVSSGKTPDATVSSYLYMDIKDNGDKSIFVKVSPNTFALRAPIKPVVSVVAPPTIANSPTIQNEKPTVGLLSFFVSDIKNKLRNLIQS